VAFFQVQLVRELQKRVVEEMVGMCCRCGWGSRNDVLY